MSQRIDVMTIGLGSSWEQARKRLARHIADMKLDYEVRSKDLHTFEFIEEKVASLPDLHLVMIADANHEMGFMEVVEGCDRLAEALAKHPNKPGVCFLHAQLLLIDSHANSPFKKAGIEVGIEPWEMVRSRLKAKVHASAAT